MEVDRRIGPDALARMGNDYKARASALRKYYAARYAEIADRTERSLK